MHLRTPQTVSVSIAGITGGANEPGCPLCTAYNATYVLTFATSRQAQFSFDFPGGVEDFCVWKYGSNLTCEDITLHAVHARAPNGQCYESWRGQFVVKSSLTNPKGFIVNFQEPYRNVPCEPRQDCCAVSGLALPQTALPINAINGLHPGTNSCGISGATATITAGAC